MMQRSVDDLLGLLRTAAIADADHDSLTEILLAWGRDNGMSGDEIADSVETHGISTVNGPPPPPGINQYLQSWWIAIVQGVRSIPTLVTIPPVPPVLLP